VAINQVIGANFSEVMNRATLISPAVAFTVSDPSAVAVIGKVNCAGTRATFTSDALLATNTVYTATITTGARDPAGNGLDKRRVQGFLPDLTMFTQTPLANALMALRVEDAITGGTEEVKTTL
jgi:hypothetical protein